MQIFIDADGGGRRDVEDTVHKWVMLGIDSSNLRATHMFLTHACSVSRSDLER